MRELPGSYRLWPVSAALLLLALPCAPEIARAQGELMIPSMEGVRVFAASYFVQFDPVTAMDLVERTPGFSPQEESGGRGLAGVRTNVLINGKRPPPKGQPIRQQLSNRPYTSVRHLELIDTNAGTSANIDMQGYTQVLNVVLDDDNGDYYELSLDQRKSGEGEPEQRNQRETDLDLIANLLLGPHEVNLRGGTFERRSRQPPEFVSIDPANPVLRIANPNRSGFDQEYLEATGDFRLPGDSTLFVSARLTQELNESSPVSPSGATGAITESFANTSDNQEVSGEYLIPIGSESELMVAVLNSRNLNARNSTFAGDGSLLSSRRDQESGETAGRVRFQHKVNDAVTLRSTLSTAYNYFEGTFNLFRDGQPQSLAGNTNRVEEDRHSLTLEADWNWKPRWVLRGNISGGAYQLEAENAPPNEQTEVKGLVSAAYQPRDRTTITLESRYDIGQLSLNQFLASSSLSSEILQAGAVRLDSEQTWEHQLRYDQRFGDRGVLKLAVGRLIVENPIRDMPLSDSLIVSQNAFAEEILFFNGDLEYPFERFGMETLMLIVGLDLRDTETVDPVSRQIRDVSWARPSEWNLGLRKDPGESEWSWGMNIWKSVRNREFGVRDTRDQQESRQWDAFLQWEPINGLRLTARMESSRDNTNLREFYSRIRTAALEPSYLAYFEGRRERSASVAIQWRRQKNLEVTATFYAQPEFNASESLSELATGASGMLTRYVAAGPEAQLRIRLYNR